MTRMYQNEFAIDRSLVNPVLVLIETAKQNFLKGAACVSGDGYPPGQIIQL